MLADSESKGKADLSKLKKDMVVELEHEEGCDEELERELRQLVHSKNRIGDKEEDPELFDASEKVLASSMQLRERTNTIQNVPPKSGGEVAVGDSRQAHYAANGSDKENVSQSKMHPVIRRSSILQLIEESQLDDSDFDESEEDYPAEEGRVGGDQYTKSEGGGKLVVGLESGYHTTAMDSLYKMKVKDNADDNDDEFSSNSMVQGENFEAMEIESATPTALDLDNSLLEVGPLDTLENTNAYTTLETMDDTGGGTDDLGPLDESLESNYPLRNETHMLETLETTIESANTSSSVPNAQETYDDKLQGNNTTDMPIDTYDLTEEDKVWRSLTNQYASINSTSTEKITHHHHTLASQDSIDTHHTLISQDTNTLDTHHTLVSQDSRGDPQTLELEENLVRRRDGWEGQFAMTGTLMLGDSQMKETLPDNSGSLNEYGTVSSDKQLTYEGAPGFDNNQMRIMDAGDLILEDEFDI